MALVVLASGAMAFWAAYLRPYQRQQRAAETLVALGAELEYEATGPPWLKR